MDMQEITGVCQTCGIKMDTIGRIKDDEYHTVKFNGGMPDKKVLVRSGLLVLCLNPECPKNNLEYLSVATDAIQQYND